MPPETASRCQLLPDQLAAYRGHAVLIMNPQGRLEQGLEGFYLHHTRFLSRLKLKVSSGEMNFVAAVPVSPHALTFYHLAPSPARGAGGPSRNPKDSGGEVAEKGIELQTNIFVGGGLHLDLHVSNHTLAPATITLAWDIAADFADQNEAESGKRQQKARVERRWTGGGKEGVLFFRYRHPELRHAAIMRFSGEAEFSERGHRVFSWLTLAPQQRSTVCLDVSPVFRNELIEPLYGRDGVPARTPAPERIQAEWLQTCTRFSTPAADVQRLWDRSTDDLRSLLLLDGNGEERFMPAAGMPKYSGLFGRDALMASWQSLLLTPATLRGTLRLVGSWTASRYEDRYDAQPGKVLHQRQLGPLALLGKTAFRHYYGDYSAPGLFLLGLADDLAWTGDRALFRALREKALETLAWMDRDGDLDGDGFYEYQTRAGDLGEKNQGWKDSRQAILYPDGGMVNDPIAVCEVQGLYYAAKKAVARAFTLTDEPERAAELEAQAEALKRRFNERFWLPEERFFALALDPEKRPVRSIASNPGACLAYGVIDDDKAAAVMERLMAPDMFSGWGVRTLSSEHPAFNPFAYHLGSVWPSPNAVIAHGLKRYGFAREGHRLTRAMFDAAQLFPFNQLPEVFGGAPRDERHPHPGIYPGACVPQAWSSSSVISMIQSLLGLMPLAPAGILILDPDLPDWLPEITIEDIRVGKSRVSLRFRRDETGQTRHEVLAMEGELRLRRLEPSPEGRGKALESAVRAALSESRQPAA